MIKRAIEIPDDIAKWEDTVMDYMDKHYQYLSDGISNISFSKKEESTKDGVGAIQYKKGEIEIVIPVIIDGGDLKEPNIGIYKEQIIPISEDMHEWIMSNTQDFGDLIQRDSQHISNMDYLQQTGLFEEPDVGGYKVAFLKETADRVQKQASLHPETQWLADKIAKIATFSPDTYVLGKNIEDVMGTGGIFANVGEYATAAPGCLPKIASAIASPSLNKKLEEMPVAKSPYVRQAFTHEHADKFPMGKSAAEDGVNANDLVQIAMDDTFGKYDGVIANERGKLSTHSGRVEFEVEPLIEKKNTPVVMIITDNKEPDPEPMTGEIYPEEHSNNPLEHKLHNKVAIIGDAYGIKTQEYGKKADSSYDNPNMISTYDMDHNVMIRMGKAKFTVPYLVESKTSGLIGANMENINVLVLMSLIDYTKIDAIVSDFPELKSIPKASVKDRQLQSMMRTNSTRVLLIPAGNIYRAPDRVIFAADKGKMISDIVNGMPATNMSVVAKTAGHDNMKTYSIEFFDGARVHQYNTRNEKVANAISSYFYGDQISAESLSEQGSVPLLENRDHSTMRKVAGYAKHNVDAFIAAAAKLPRSISKSFAKAASVSEVVNGLIGVSFVDEANQTDVSKISEQVLSLINALGNLILMSRMGKTAIPEADVNRAFWALADMLKAIRG